MSVPPLAWDSPGAQLPHFPMVPTSVVRDCMVCVPARVQELELAAVDLAPSGDKIVTPAPAASPVFRCALWQSVPTNPGLLLFERGSRMMKLSSLKRIFIQFLNMDDIDIFQVHGY